MPSSETEKTKLAPKLLEPKVRRTKWLWRVSRILGPMLMVVALSFIFWTLSHSIDDGVATVRIGDNPEQGKSQEASASQPWRYAVVIADTPEKQQRGLSATESLSADKGMLFAYDSVAERCFWMKDMRYGLDIIWLDEAKKAIAIEQSITPQTYPQTFCHDARYVLELKAGEVAKNGLQVGEYISF